MTLTLVATLLSAVAAAACVRDGRRLQRRSRASSPPRGRAAQSQPRWVLAVRSRVPVALTGIVVWAACGGVVGVMAGVLCAVVAERLRRRSQPPLVRTRRRRLARDLPVAADLLAACLSAGATTPAAAAAVSRAVGGPVGEALTRVVVLLELGAAPTEAWAGLGHDAELLPLARAFVRAAECGAPPVKAVALLADDLRAAARARAEAAARRVGVRVTAPLGLCFLPAFALLGVVPVVLGIASSLAGAVVP